MLRRARLILPLLAATLGGALAGCGGGHVAAQDLDVGFYAGTLPDGSPVTLAVDGATDQLDGRDTYLVDAASTAQFLVASGRGYREWSCHAAEGGKAVHCDVWTAPGGGATPTAIPCVSPVATAPSWCGGTTHLAVDLLRICSNAGCST